MKEIYLLDFIDELVARQFNFNSCREAISIFDKRANEENVDYKKEELENCHRRIRRVCSSMGYPEVAVQVSDGIYPLKCIPIEACERLIRAVEDILIEEGDLEAAKEDLLFKWGIDPSITGYIVGEAVRNARLRKLTLEEFEAIGQDYVAQMSKIIQEEDENFVLKK